jgi:photosystem II stability/assembly factor-like uncharacterized protein
MKRTLPICIILIFIAQIALSQSGKWVRIGTHDDPPKGSKIIAGPNKLVYIISSSGTYVSYDGGDNWRPMMFSGVSQNLSAFVVAPSGTLFGMSDTAFYWSRDQYTWEQIPAPAPTFRVGDVTSVAFDNSNTLFFAVPTKGVFRLNPDNSYSRVIALQKFSGIHDMCFDRAGKLYILTDSLLRFDNSFHQEKAWAHTWWWADSLRRVGNQMVITGDSIWSNLDATVAVHKLPYANFIVVDSTNNLDYYSQGDLERSTDLGVSWHPFGNDPNIASWISMQATQSGFISQRTSGAVMFSRDTGKTFTELQSFNDLLTFTAIAVDPQGMIHAFDSIDGHWTSQDGGRHWALAKQSTVFHYGPTRLRITDEAKFYVSTLDYDLESSDLGKSFHGLPHPNVSGAKTYNVYCVNPGRLYSYADNGMISRSTDAGTTWTDLGDLKGTNQSITQDPDWMSGFAEIDSNIWATGLGNLYHSTNSGKFWSVSTPGLYGAAELRDDLWAGRGGTIFLRLNENSYHWLGKNEAFSYSSWVQCPGPIVQKGDSDVIGAIPFASSPYHVDELIRQHRGHTALDTLLFGPDSLAITQMALDSAGNLYGTGYPTSRLSSLHGFRGIYKFFPTGADVATPIRNDAKLEIVAIGSNISVRSPRDFTEVVAIDMLGRRVFAQSFAPRNECSFSVRAGAYLVQVRSGSFSATNKIVVGQ